MASFDTCLSDVTSYIVRCHQDLRMLTETNVGPGFRVRKRCYQDFSSIWRSPLGAYGAFWYIQGRDLSELSAVTGYDRCREADGLDDAWLEQLACL